MEEIIKIQRVKSSQNKKQNPQQIVQQRKKANIQDQNWKSQFQSSESKI